jgi:hypothetical protein
MSIPITALSESFPPDTVKQRKGNFGNMLDYVDAVSVINRLNEALEGQWSFTIIDHRTDVDEMIVLGQMEIDGVIRQQFGGTQITRNKDSGVAVSLADDLKAACSDCLKKCAASFGVGLYLYNGKPVRQQQNHYRDNGNGHTHQSGSNGNGTRTNGNGRISNQMIAQLFSDAKASGVAQSQVIKIATEMFHKPISQLSMKQAEELLNQFMVPQN